MLQIIAILFVPLFIATMMFYLWLALGDFIADLGD